MGPSPRSRSNAPRLNIGNAVHDGWTAFSHAPTALIGVALVAVLLWLLLVPLQQRLTPGGVLSRQPLDLLLGVVGWIGIPLVYCWGSARLVRGAREALLHQRPRFARLMRWDGAALRHLFPALLLLVAIALLVVLAMVLILWLSLILLSLLDAWAGPGSMDGFPLLVDLLVRLAALALEGVLVLVLLYLMVNQQFMAPIAVFEGLGPLDTLRRGCRVVDPQWVLVLLLGLIQLTLIGVGLLTGGVGLFVAWPVMICISTAAYRQLFVSPSQSW
jgi:hypothetical protein